MTVKYNLKTKIKALLFLGKPCHRNGKKPRQNLIKHISFSAVILFKNLRLLLKLWILIAFFQTFVLLFFV